MKKLKLDNPQAINDRLMQIYHDTSNHFVCRNAEIKYLFRPHLDDKEIWNAWFSDLKKGEQMVPHRDTQGTITFIFYLKASGASPLIVSGKSYKVKTNQLYTYDAYEEHSVPPIKESHRLALVIETSTNIKKGSDFEDTG